jgi:hypothetical protein
VRAQQAAIVASIAAFAVAAGVDWVWQIPAIPVVALLLLGAGAAGEARRGSVLEGEENEHRSGGRGRGARTTIAWAALAALGTAAILVPMASAVSVRSSQTQAQAGRLTSALHSAKTAAGWQPLPSPGFRGALARLIGAAPLPRAIAHWRPKALALAAVGALLLALAGAGVAGEGPLAPSGTAAATASPSSASR